MNNIEEWHKIGDTLTGIFRICSCQRKLKTIIDNLYDIYIKLQKQEYSFTGAEWLLIAMIDKNTDAICHGINCEYPILIESDPLWEFVLSAHENPALEDN